MARRVGDSLPLPTLMRQSEVADRYPPSDRCRYTPVSFFGGEGLNRPNFGLRRKFRRKSFDLFKKVRFHLHTSHRNVSKLTLHYFMLFFGQYFKIVGLPSLYVALNHKPFLFFQWFPLNVKTIIFTNIIFN